MTKLCFSLSVSSFIINYIIKYHASKLAASITRDALLNCYYSDNLFFTSSNPQILLEVYKNSVNIMKNANMNIRNFSSSDPELNKVIESDGKLFKNSNEQKMLGYKLCFINNEAEVMKLSDFDIKPGKITKSNLISHINSIFDILGFTTPVTMQGRILFSEACKRKIEWNDYLPEDIQMKWNSHT